MGPNRTWIVTGANAGLGYECSRALAQKPGNLVVLACRNVARGEEATQALRRAGAATSVLPLDLASLASVRAFAAAFRGAGLPPLSGLICNAGLQSVAAPTCDDRWFRDDVRGQSPRALSAGAAPPRRSRRERRDCICRQRRSRSHAKDGHAEAALRERRGGRARPRTRRRGWTAALCELETV